MTILIVDDNARMRRMLRGMLTKHFDTRITIHECSDGEETTASVRKHKPDWVLMDIKMPHVDGFTAAREILDMLPQTKIVIVTSYDEPQYRDEARSLGVKGYVLKDNLLDVLQVLRHPEGPHSGIGNDMRT